MRASFCFITDFVVLAQHLIHRIPVDPLRQPQQRVLQRNNVIQLMTKQVVLRCVVRCPGIHEICKVLRGNIEKAEVLNRDLKPDSTANQERMDSSGPTNYTPRVTTLRHSYGGGRLGRRHAAKSAPGTVCWADSNTGMQRWITCLAGYKTERGHRRARGGTAGGREGVHLCYLRPQSVRLPCAWEALGEECDLPFGPIDDAEIARHRHERCIIQRSRCLGPRQLWHIVPGCSSWRADVDSRDRTSIKCQLVRSSSKLREIRCRRLLIFPCCVFLPGF